jgi:hypothetical protein
LTSVEPPIYCVSVESYVEFPPNLLGGWIRVPSCLRNIIHCYGIGED